MIATSSEQGAMMGGLKDIRVEQPTSEAGVVEFTGEHDLSQADRIQSLLESLVEQNAVVVADFSEAEFVDSSVLRTLFRAHLAAESRGKSFRLQLGTASVVERAFKLSGLLELLSCSESRAEALNATGQVDTKGVGRAAA
jgi:anti-anti-sigma factor